MKTVLGFLLFSSFMGLLKAEDLNTRSISELYRLGYIVKATIINENGLVFIKNSSMKRVSFEEPTKVNTLGCFLHLKETAYDDMVFPLNEVIYFHSNKVLQKKYGRRGKYLHMEFLTSNKHDLIGGLRIGQKFLNDFLWYDTTYKKSVNELNELCQGIEIEAIPNSYASTAEK